MSKKKLLLGCLVLGIFILVVSAVTWYTIKTTLEDLIYRSSGDAIKSTTPADLGLSYRDIEFVTRSGLRIQGWFIQGKSESCILLGPGKGANRWDVLRYAPFLHQAGYSVLLFDPRSTGLSQGEKYGFGYFESRDMIQAADYLQSRHQIEHIGILGFSAGGTAALLAALEHPDVKAVVAESAFASLERAATNSMSGLPKFFFQAVLPVFRFESERMLGVDVFQELNLTHKIQDLEKPVFFIHGQKDQIISPANSKLLHSLAPGPQEIWLVPGTGHTEAFSHNPELFKERILDFFGQSFRD